MTRVLRSAAKKGQNTEDLSLKLSVSKKPKITKEKIEKSIKTKIEDKKQNDIWNINSVLYRIFTYTDRKDLLEFNTVCKKWNNLLNPIIYKNVKLIRNLSNTFDSGDKSDAEVAACISNNAKHAHLVRELSLNFKLKPQRVIKVFETFRFISNLTIGYHEMNQDQFLDLISPLTQLQELTLRSLNIKKNVRNRVYKEAVQLPLTLKKLRIYCINLIGNPELFVKTINSHSNLKEFSTSTDINQGVLEPFYKHYPSLLNFELTYGEVENTRLLINIFEKNYQLTNLKLTLKCWDSELTSSIASYLRNLEEFSLTEFINHQNYTDPFLKFSQPTKIKKLNLVWRRVRNCSLDSILSNCPQLEDLTFNVINDYILTDFELNTNLSKPCMIEKLSIIVENAGIAEFESLLLNCPHLKELIVNLPSDWKEAIQSIYQNCSTLQILDITSPNRLYANAKDIISQELYEAELFSTTSKFKSTLTHLTLNGFKATDSKSDYFKSFEKLKSIKYLGQPKIDYKCVNQDNEIDMTLWPGYRLLSKNAEYTYNIELKKI
jgi:hypothetical protein